MEKAEGNQFVPQVKDEQCRQNTWGGVIVINKIYNSVAAAIEDVFDGATILFGGFGGSGVPGHLIEELAEKGTGRITGVSNNCGNFEVGLAKLIKNGQIKKMICSFPAYEEGYVFKEKFLTILLSPFLLV